MSPPSYLSQGLAGVWAFGASSVLVPKVASSWPSPSSCCGVLDKTSWIQAHWSTVHKQLERWGIFYILWAAWTPNILCTGGYECWGEGWKRKPCPQPEGEAWQSKAASLAKFWGWMCKEMSSHVGRSSSTRHLLPTVAVFLSTTCHLLKVYRGEDISV